MALQHQNVFQPLLFSPKLFFLEPAFPQIGFELGLVSYCTTESCITLTGLINLYEHSKTLKQLKAFQLLYKVAPHSCIIYIEYNMGLAKGQTSSKVSKQVNK
jgi:hypothetical protein